MSSNVRRLTKKDYYSQFLCFGVVHSKFFTQPLLPLIQVIFYSGDRAYEDYYEPMKGRVHFNSADPKNGDASINLTGLKSSDSGTYQCKVKKAPGIRSRKMKLIVMGEWNKPAKALFSQGEFCLCAQWTCTKSHDLWPPWLF